MGAKVISPKDTAPQGGSRLTTLVVDTDQLTSPGSILGMVAYVSTAGPIRTKSLYNAGCWPVYRLGLLQFYLRKVSLVTSARKVSPACVGPVNETQLLTVRLLAIMQGNA